MLTLDIGNITTTDMIAIYAALVATGAAVIEIFRYFRERLKLSLQATTTAFYEGDFELDMNPETMWRITAIIRNTGGLPVVIERAEYVTYSNRLLRWLRKPRQAYRATTKLPIDLDPGKIAHLTLTIRDQTYAERATGNQFCLAVYHSRSKRPLVVAIPYRNISSDQLSAMWSSYDGGMTDEQEATLERIERKRREQFGTFKTPND